MQEEPEYSLQAKYRSLKRFSRQKHPNIYSSLKSKHVFVPPKFHIDSLLVGSKLISQDMNSHRPSSAGKIIKFNQKKQMPPLNWEKTKIIEKIEIKFKKKASIKSPLEIIKDYKTQKKDSQNEYLENIIESDRQFLNTNKHIDFQIFTLKIKAEEVERKTRNLKKWSNFQFENQERNQYFS